MLSLLLILVAAISNAIMDVLWSRFDKSIFSNRRSKWWNPNQSWKNKWSMPLRQVEKGWYYFGILPEYVERFPYSSTFLVWLTDAWHFFKAIMIICILGSIVCYKPILGFWYDALILYTVWGTVFTAFYSKILIRKD